MGMNCISNHLAVPTVESPCFKLKESLDFHE